MGIYKDFKKQGTVIGNTAIASVMYELKDIVGNFSGRYLFFKKIEMILSLRHRYGLIRSVSFLIMHPILKDWLQNLGCFLPLAFFSGCLTFIMHWISTEAGPVKAVIIFQARLLEGQHFPRLTLAIFLVPTVLVAWLIAVVYRSCFRKLGVYDRPNINGGFEHPEQRT